MIIIIFTKAINTRLIIECHYSDNGDKHEGNKSDSNIMITKVLQEMVFMVATADNDSNTNTSDSNSNTNATATANKGRRNNSADNATPLTPKQQRSKVNIRPPPLATASVRHNNTRCKPRAQKPQCQHLSQLLQHKAQLQDKLLQHKAQLQDKHMQLVRLE